MHALIMGTILSAGLPGDEANRCEKLLSSTVISPEFASWYSGPVMAWYNTKNIANIVSTHPANDGYRNTPYNYFQQKQILQHKLPLNWIKSNNIIVY